MKLSHEKEGYIKDVLMDELKSRFEIDKKTLQCLIEYKQAHIRNLQLVIEAATRLLKKAK